MRWPSRSRTPRPGPDAWIAKGEDAEAAVWIGIMRVSPPRTSALWSEGPAPPVRERPGASPLTQRAPRDWSSVISATGEACDAASGVRGSIGSDLVAMTGVLLVTGIV